MGVSNLVSFIGVLLVLHAGYSTTHFKDLVLNSAHGDISLVQIPPYDVILECCIGFVVCMAGVILSTKPLKPAVTQGSASKVINSVISPEFNVFNHAGKSFQRRIKPSKR
mmetsp:Transcript_7269/g.9696  ORF Transcript_7269/g.9696 Transcript_7269/m.9696 type:complete len:110 (+) Transcript_7269:101-430(+)